MNSLFYGRIFFGDKHPYSGCVVDGLMELMFV
jgi:hypothetical protein